MHKLYELKDKLIGELEDYADNGKFSKDDAESIKALSASVEHLCNIADREDEDGYSMRGTSYNDGMGYSRRYSRADDMSMARGRTARRDPMGRYSRADGPQGEAVEDIKRDMQRLMDKIEKM